MDPQFQELASEIADAVEKRLSGTFEERIKAHIDKFEKRADASFKQHMDEFEKRADDSFKTHINELEKRAELRMKMHFENLETNVTLAAEGYDGTLKGIERRLTEINTDFKAKFGDHDLALTDNGKRITTLEDQR
jgi:hypothetical protein